MGAWMVDRGRIVSLGQVPSQSLAAAGGDTQSVVSPRGEGGGCTEKSVYLLLEQNPPPAAAAFVSIVEPALSPHLMTPSCRTEACGAAQPPAPWTPAGQVSGPF